MPLHAYFNLGDVSGSYLLQNSKGGYSEGHWNASNSTWFHLTHWGRVTHICVGNLTIIGSDNGLSPGRRQAIIWTNAGILLIGPLGTNFSEILIEMHTFSFKKMHLKMSSAKWRLFGLGLNELIKTSFLSAYVWHWRTGELVLNLFLCFTRVSNVPVIHDDVIKWKHFPRYWPFVRGIHRSPVNSPHKRQRRGALMFSLISARIIGWVNNREAGDLRRIRPHYDVTVMKSDELAPFQGLSLFKRWWLIACDMIIIWPQLN